MKRLILLSLVALSGCGSTPSDPERGPVVLHCEGTQTTEVFGASSRAKNYDFRIDGPARKFEVWNDEKSEWNTWGEQLELEITRDRIVSSAMTSGSGAAARRRTEFDRATGRVTDEINVLPIGSVSFEGTCKPVKAPVEAKRKF